MGLVLKDFGEHKMYLHERDPGISRTLKKPGGYKKREIEFMTVLREQLEEGSTAMDIGANIGFVTLAMAKKVGPEGKVISVEPVKKNLKALRKNVDINNYQDRVEIHSLAFSNRNGEGAFFESKRSNLGRLEDRVKDTAGERIVEVMTIDSFVERHNVVPTFYKMDIEGHEIQVLEGMMKTLEATPHVKILMEVHPTLYKEPDRMAANLRALIQMGFGPRYVISAAVGLPDLFKEKGYKPTRVFESSGWERGLFEGVDPEDMIHFTAYKHRQLSKNRKKTSKKIVRAVMLEK